MALTSFSFYGILPNFASRSFHHYYINFVHNLDPNKGGPQGKYPEWPQWSKGRKLLQFFNNRAVLLDDDFRSESCEYIKKHVDVLQI